MFCSCWLRKRKRSQPRILMSMGVSSLQARKATAVRRMSERQLTAAREKTESCSLPAHPDSIPSLKHSIADRGLMAR